MWTEHEAQGTEDSGGELFPSFSGEGRGSGSIPRSSWRVLRSAVDTSTVDSRVTTS